MALDYPIRLPLQDSGMIFSPSPGSLTLSPTLLLLLLGLLGLVFTACGGSEPTRPASGDGGVGSLNGKIAIDGSSTVYPITEAVAEEFGILTRRNVRITVGVSGTGGGFKKFCNGETVVTDASRPIKASEAERCARSGIEFVEIPVALDGLTVMVNPENDFVTCVTLAELHHIWGPDAEDKIVRWNQVRPEWPDRPLRLYGPGVDSGTFDYFTATINGQAQSSRGDFTSSEDDNLLVHGIYGDKNSLGYFGYAYFRENREKLKPLQIDGGDGCVAPTEETINGGSYSPLSRPLFIYVSNAALQEPHVKEFIRYYIGPEGWALISEVGYIPFPESTYRLISSRVEAGVTGSIFGGASPQSGPVEQVLSANQ